MFTTSHSSLRRIAACLLGALAALAPVVAGAPSASAAVIRPTILLPNMVVPEGDSGKAPIVVNVALSAPNPFTHSVTVQVTDFSAFPLPTGGTYGTAVAGSDYVAFAPFNLTFQPGQQVARFAVQLKGDTTVEGNEEIDVRFDNTEFNVADNDIDLIVSNDDGTPHGTKPLLQPPNHVISEADAGCYSYQVSIPISRPATLRSTIEAFDYTGVWTPGPRFASVGSDYLAFPTKVLAYATGKRVTTLPITICGDTAVEGNEEIDVRFAGGNGALQVGDNDIDLVQANDD